MKKTHACAGARRRRDDIREGREVRALRVDVGATVSAFRIESRGDNKRRTRHAQGDEQRDHVELPKNGLECEVPVVHIHEREIGDERRHGAGAWWDGCLPCYNHQPRHNLNKMHVKLLAMPWTGKGTYAAKSL